MFKRSYKAPYVRVVLKARAWRRVPMKLLKWGRKMPSTKQYNLVPNDEYDTRIPLHPDEAFTYGITFQAKWVQISANQKCNVKLMKEFIWKYHLCNYMNPDQYIKQLQIKCEIKTRVACYFMIFFLMADCGSWNLLTAFNNYYYIELIRNRTMIYQTPIYTIWPIDYRYDFKNWLLVHFFNTIMLTVGCIMILFHNSMNFAFVIQLIGHIKILQHKLKTQFLGKHTDEEVKEKLVDLINYHCFILSFFREVQTAFGLHVTGSYLYNLLADSLLLYELMVGAKSNQMMFGMMIVAYLGGLILMSFVLEDVHTQSNVLSNLAYYVPWEDMSISNRKILYVMMLRFQLEMVFTSSCGLKCGVLPMMSIIKSTFSYYVMLKNGDN